MPPRFPQVSPRPVVHGRLRFLNKLARDCMVSSTGSSSHCVSPVLRCCQYGCMTAQFICLTHASSERVKRERSRRPLSRRWLPASCSSTGSDSWSASVRPPAKGALDEPSGPELEPLTAPISTAVRSMLANLGMEKGPRSSSCPATPSSHLESMLLSFVASREIIRSPSHPLLVGTTLYSMVPPARPERESRLDRTSCGARGKMCEDPRLSGTCTR